VNAPARTASSAPSVLVCGGGIGGLAAALALTKVGVSVTVLEQAQELGEIGAGVQLGPNAFSAFDALGISERARARAVYTERLMLLDAVDGSEIANMPVGEAFRARFGNPYAVIHRADIHHSLLEGVQENGQIALETSTRVERIEQAGDRVVAIDQRGRSFDADAVVGCDGGKSLVRQQYVDEAEFPADLKYNAPVVWCGPNCHLVHYPLRGGQQYNVVVTFHSRKTETWSITDGSQEEVLTYFTDIVPRARQLLSLPKSWRRWATADREPIAQWTFGRVTLLGDAAHPMLQYLAQGACMALEDSVTLGEAVRRSNGDLAAAFERYQRSRVTRTARVLLMTREMGRIYHAKGIERLVRNDLWKDRTPERFYDALEWLYGWKPERCLVD
jgi:2-polyprenyl-6-methoxyphenol hydroxylase-like FAD-dependent oxidoreductase